MKKRTIIISALLIIFIAYGLTYIPRRVISLDPTNISKITIFNGTNGSQVEITDQSDIEHIVSNLSEVKFQKEKSSLGYLGYTYRATFYNNKDKAIKELIINSNDTIRYRWFFYTAKDNVIDIEYISSLFNNN